MRVTKLGSRTGLVNLKAHRCFVVSALVHLGAKGPVSSAAQQSLAADGAIACFSSNLFPLSLNADRAPQLKAGIRRLKLTGGMMICTLPRTLFFLILVGPVSLSVATIRPPGECKAPSSREVKDALGQPVECEQDSADAVCFKNKEAFVMARFSPQGFAKSLYLSTSNGMIRINGLMNQIVPDKYRGRFSKRVEKSERYACQNVYVDEYECLSIEYAQENCMGSMPATIKVIWKKSPNASDASMFVTQGLSLTAVRARR